MTSLDSTVRLEAASLNYGDTRYVTCPVCDRAGKLSISRKEDGTVLYHCFRDTCGVRGRLRGTGGSLVHTSQNALRSPTRAGWRGEVVPLPPEVESVLTGLGLSPSHIQRGRVMWAEKERRVAYPILSPFGERRGWCLRSYCGATPKALTYLDGDVPRLSYYVKGGRRVILVEDIPSALRASQYVDAIALLGTSCSVEGAAEIARYYDDVVWALDSDATAIAVAMKQRHSFLFDRSSVMVLEQDLKDMDESELEELLCG